MNIFEIIEYLNNKNKEREISMSEVIIRLKLGNLEQKIPEKAVEAFAQHILDFIQKKFHKKLLNKGVDFRVEFFDGERILIPLRPKGWKPK